MADGREEREQRDKRREEEKKENHDDRVNPESSDDGEPERQDS